MISRRLLFTATLGALAAGMAGVHESAAQVAPEAGAIVRKLGQAPRVQLQQQDRVSRGTLKRRPDLRRIAPSIDIQAINFQFGSATIPVSERWKVEQIGIAMNQMMDRRDGEVFLIEGHTDAVGTRGANQNLSVARAQSLKRDLVRYFGVPSFNLDTVGYGEDYLLVPTPYENWRNRRVTLRRITDVITPY
jgi:outer membrane protein OmpA-like peptidoglycan-associated protein